jgi:hypothetical protein
MPTTAIATFGVGILVPLKNPDDAVLESLGLQPSTTFPTGQVLYEQTAGVYGLYTGAETLVAATTAITETGTVGTYTVANTLVAGNTVRISGAVPDGYNGTFQVATAVAGSFTVNGLPAGLVTPATVQGVVRIAQVPTHLNQYACITDASGNVSFGTGITAGATEFGQTSKSAPAFRAGYFSCADLVGLDQRAVAILGRLVQGTIAAGHFIMNGN